MSSPKVCLLALVMLATACQESAPSGARPVTRTRTRTLQVSGYLGGCPSSIEGFTVRAPAESLEIYEVGKLLGVADGSSGYIEEQNARCFFRFEVPDLLRSDFYVLHHEDGEYLRWGPWSYAALERAAWIVDINGDEGGPTSGDV